MAEQNITTRIENLLAENKKSVKTYARFESADRAARKVINQYLTAHGVEKTARPIDFTVVYLPIQQRFTPVILFQNWISSNSVGGFIGYFAQKGFMQI